MLPSSTLPALLAALLTAGAMARFDTDGEGSGARVALGVLSPGEGSPDEGSSDERSQGEGEGGPEEAGPGSSGRQDPDVDPILNARELLVESLAEQGIRMDLNEGWCAFDVDVAVREDLLEYLLVGPGGRTHESLFMTRILPSLLNTAMLTLGGEPGTNASWVPKDPPPSEEELREGVLPYLVTLPQGTEFYLYAAWEEGEDLYFYRIEDLINNLTTGRSLRRHAWVFLGSEIVPHPSREGDEVFAADLYQDLINVAFFPEGFTLLTSAVAECVEQQSWSANAWLVPPTGSKVRMVISLERLRGLPPSLLEQLPRVGD